jgi:hypothetical protein
VVVPIGWAYSDSLPRPPALTTPSNSRRSLAAGTELVTKSHSDLSQKVLLLRRDLDAMDTQIAQREVIRAISSVPWRPCLTRQELSSATLRRLRCGGRGIRCRRGCAS